MVNEKMEVNRGSGCYLQFREKAAGLIFRSCARPAAITAAS